MNFIAAAPALLGRAAHTSAPSSRGGRARPDSRPRCGWRKICARRSGRRRAPARNRRRYRCVARRDCCRGRSRTATAIANRAGVADALCDRADADVAEIDMPAVAAVRALAAGEVGHGDIKADDCAGVESRTKEPKKSGPVPRPTIQLGLRHLGLRQNASGCALHGADVAVFSLFDTLIRYRFIFVHRPAAPPRRRALRYGLKFTSGSFQPIPAPAAANWTDHEAF